MGKNGFRLLSVVVTIVLLLSVMAGCGSSNTSSEATSVTATSTVQAASTVSTEKFDGKGVELQFYMLGDAPKDLQLVSDEVNKLAKNDLNLTVKYNFIPWTDWQTKYKVILSTGQNIDLIYSSNWTGRVQYEIQGAFQPLDDIIPKVAPDLDAYVTKEWWDGLRNPAAGNKFYLIPGTIKEYGSVGTVWREDLRVKYNLPEPTTIENMEAYLEGIKKNDNTIAPTVSTASSGDFPTTETLQIKYKWDMFPNGAYGLAATDEKPREVFNYYASPDFVADAKIFKRWADKGFWSKSALSSKERNEDVLKSGKAAATVGNMNAVTMASIQASVAQSHPDWKFKFFPFAQATGLLHPTSYDNNGFAVPKASKSPEAAVAFYAKMVLDKNYNHLTEYGIQGKHYDINPDGTYKALIPQDTSPFKREAMDGWAWRNASLQVYEKEFTPVIEIFKEFDKISTPNRFAAFGEDTTNYQTEKAQYETIRQQYLNPIFAGLVPDVDAAVKTFLEKAKAAGLEKMQQEYTKQWLKYCDDHGIN